MVMNNKIKFLVSSLVILGGYATASEPFYNPYRNETIYNSFRQKTNINQNAKENNNQIKQKENNIEQFENKNQIKYEINNNQVIQNVEQYKTINQIAQSKNKKQIEQFENNNQIKQDNINNQIIQSEHKMQIEQEEDSMQIEKNNTKVAKEGNNNQIVQNKIDKQNKYVTMYHKYLEELCKKKKIDLDENGNIIENEKFFDKIKFQNIRMLHLLHKTDFIDIDDNGEIVNPHENISYCILYNCRCFDDHGIIPDLRSTLKSYFSEQNIDYHCRIPDVDSMLSLCSKEAKEYFDVFKDFDLLDEKELGVNPTDTCGAFEYSIYDFARLIEFHDLQNSLSLKYLKEKYPKVITITSDKKYITVKELETYFKNKIYILDINYILSVLTYSDNLTKLKQEITNYHSKITSIINCLSTLLKNDFKVPEEKISKYYDEISSFDELLDSFDSFYKDSDGNILIEDEEKNNFIFYNDYIPQFFKSLESESKKNLYSLIKDEKFLEFVNDSYQTFSDLKTKIQQIISQHNLNDVISSNSYMINSIVWLPNNVLSDIKKIFPNIKERFPNNKFKKDDLKEIKYTLNYCTNTISEVGTLQLCNTIQQCINKYKNNNDEDELKNKIKSKIIKICHDLIPLKNLAIKLLQVCINNHEIIERNCYNGVTYEEGRLYYNLFRNDFPKLITKLKEKANELKNSEIDVPEVEKSLLPKLLKLHEAREIVIPQLGSGLEEFAAKYNIQLSEEQNKIEQNNIDDE